MAETADMHDDENMSLFGMPMEKPYEYTVRMGHGWTLEDGTFDHVPLDRRRKREVPFPTFVNHTFRASNGLSNLQLHRHSPINHCALDTAHGHLWNCMPAESRKHLYLAPPNGPALWSEDKMGCNQMLDQMDGKQYHIWIDEENGISEYRPFHDMKKRAWVIVPIWVEDKWGKDWVTIIWHSRASDEMGKHFDELVAFAIIDPRRHPTADANGKHGPIQERLDRIRDRLFTLWDKGRFKRDKVEQFNVLSCPMPLDEATSGERCFAAVKELLNQITNWFITGMNFDPASTLRNLSQWVNPFQQRVEMTGINAWLLMSTLDYNARIVVEALPVNTLTEVAADGDKKYLYNYDLAGPYEDPPLAAWDYMLPANNQFSPPQQTTTSSKRRKMN